MVSASPIHAVLLDLDDTLFDHRRSAMRAVQSLRDQVPGLGVHPLEEIERVNRTLLEEIHLRVLSGEIDTDDARIERMARLFAHFGLPSDAIRAAEVAANYRRGYSARRREVKGALPLLRELRRRGLRVGIVTNNTTREQEEKVTRLGFTPYIDALVVSEAVGSWKPAARIFETALETLGVTPAEAVMVGDSWTSDVVGALGAGIVPVWYNPLGQIPPSPSPPPVPQIDSLEPASDIVDRILAASLAE